MRTYCTYLVKEGTDFHSHHLLAQIKNFLRYHDYILKVANGSCFHNDDGIYFLYFHCYYSPK